MSRVGLESHSLYRVLQSEQARIGKVDEISIYLSNTLSGEKEVFRPQDAKNVRMYACGPTVYDRPHLGNARAAVVYDLLFRLLREIYDTVTYARNVTDVDDKIIAAAEKANRPIDEITTEMLQYYHDDIAALNCLSPTIEPKATEHIPEMISMIESLISNGYAYVAEQHVLFDITKFADYGKLSHRNMEEMIAGARVEVAPFKRNPADFVLWKPGAHNADNVNKIKDADKSDHADHNYDFDSPWGRGRPGWHIECSAMSAKHLGKTFDIHGGGADLKFPHHENEIAQSCCANESSVMAHYWVHNGFLTVEGEKMSKSLGNFTTVRQVLEQGIAGVVIRYFYLTTHYHKPIDFNMKSIEDAKKSLLKFSHILSLYKDQEMAVDLTGLAIFADDLNTPKLIAHMHQLAKDAKDANAGLEAGAAAAAAAKLRYNLTLLGLDISDILALSAGDEQEIPQKVIDMAEQRVQAKKQKDWQAADSLREAIRDEGYQVEDLANHEYKIIKSE